MTMSDCTVTAHYCISQRSEKEHHYFRPICTLQHLLIMGIFRQTVLGIDLRTWVLLVILICTTDASECEKGQYFEDAIRLCLPCNDKCQPDGIPKLCPLSCKGWNLTTPTAKCPKGYVWSEAIGRCSKCSITCSQVGEHKCPLECDGWLVKKIPRPTNKTKGPNPKNSGETLNKRISKDKKAGHPGLYALVIPAIVLVIGGGVAVRKLKKDRRASGPQGGRELQPLNNQGNNPDIENQVLENPTANEASYNPENAGGNEETRVHGQPDDADDTPCVL